MPLLKTKGISASDLANCEGSVNFLLPGDQTDRKIASVNVLLEDDSGAIGGTPEYPVIGAFATMEQALERIGAELPASAAR